MSRPTTDPRCPHCGCNVPRYLPQRHADEQGWYREECDECGMAFEYRVTVLYETRLKEAK